MNESNGSLPTYRLEDAALLSSFYLITQLLSKWNMQPRNAARRLLQSSSIILNGQIGGWGAWVTYQSSMRPAEWIPGPHHIFDALHFLLVAVAVLHGAFLRFLQCTLQRLDSVSCRPKTFLQFWKLTAKICIVTHQLSQTQHTQEHTQ